MSVYLDRFPFERILQCLVIGNNLEELKREKYTVHVLGAKITSNASLG